MVNPPHATKAVSSSVPYSSSTVKEEKGVDLRVRRQTPRLARRHNVRRAAFLRL